MPTTLTAKGYQVKCRRAYFALCRKLGLDEAARHAMNAARTGKTSTRDFTQADWKEVVGFLQAEAGMDAAPGRPRLRRSGAGTSTAREAESELATPAQVGTLEGLSARVLWRTTPAHFVRARVLAPVRKLIWDGRWEMLFRDEATKAILALQRMALN